MAHKRYPYKLREKIFDILKNNINDLLRSKNKSSLDMSQSLRIDPMAGDSKENCFGDSFISDILSGKTMPSLESLYVLAKSNNITMDILVCEEGNKSPRFSELLSLAIEKPRVYQRMLAYCSALKEGEHPAVIEKRLSDNT